MNNINIALMLLCTLLVNSCSELLKEDVYSQLDPASLFESSNGIERVLFGAYRDAQVTGNFGGNIWFQEEWTCDQMWETGGAVNLQAVVMLGFTWDPSYPNHWTTLWQNCYASIRNCNIVLENIDNAPIVDDVKERLKAEARFIRASVYYNMYNWWGAVPLRLSSLNEVEMSRATDEEMKNFIESEFLAIIPILPDKGEISGYQYGRATKGAALGYLTKFYLNTKQWEKCVDYGKQLMQSGLYQLWPDYTTLFNVENEQVNDEFIWIYTNSPQGPGCEFINGAFPTDFASTVDGSIVFRDNWRNWARQDRVLDEFYNFFYNKDKTRDLIITEYVNTKGDTVSLLDDDNTRSFKYNPDVNANGNAHGNDVAVIRYSDIILSVAEALNELYGPTQESMDLIQMVRDRAGLTNSLNLHDYDKESFRDRILDERGWEFYCENLRRQDLIRHDKFISSAQSRGLKHVRDDHKLFPIPQIEIDANSLCIQNAGY